MPDLPAVQSVTPMALLQQATESGASIEALEKLMDLQERWEAREADKALHAALGAFQAECPSIRKEKTSGTGGYAYTYAALDDIERQIRPMLTAHGLSYTHDVEVVGDQMVVTCTIHHVGGASRESRWTGPNADAGKMSAIQKVGSATTYARRYSLVNALGLTTTDEDDDGASADPARPIDNEQLATITDLLNDIDATPDRIAKFCRWLNAETLSEIRAANYSRAANYLRDKKAEMAKGSA